MKYLSQQECKDIRSRLTSNGDTLAFKAIVHHANDYLGRYESDGDFRMEVYIARDCDGAACLVTSRIEPQAEPITFGLSDSSDEALENIYAALACSEDDFLRAVISTAGLGDYYGVGLFDDVEISVNEPLSPSVMELLANDSDPAIRRCIALSPLAPQAIFAMLVDDADPYNRAVAASSSRVTTSMLDRLSNDQAEEVRESVARNNRTPPIVLKRLGEDSSIRVLHGVACNPHTPSSTLHKISHIDSEEALTSRAISLYGVVYITSGEIKRAVAGNPNVSAATLRELLDEADAFARAHMPTNKDEFIDADGMHYGLIRQRIAANSSAPPEILDELADYRDYEVWANIVNNPNVTCSALEKTARAIMKGGYVDLDLSEAIINNPLLPISCLEMFSFSGINSERRLVWYCPRTPPHIKQRLSYDPWLFAPDSATPYPQNDERKRFPVIEDPTPLLEILSLSNNPYDRVVAAQDQNTRVEILDRLGLDYSASVRAAVASNRYADERTLRRLVNDSNKYVRASLASNENLPAEVISFLLGDAEEEVLIKIASREDLPPETLAQLAAHESRSVRAAAISNTNLPHDQAVQIALGDLFDIKLQVALRDDLSQEEYEAIMDDAIAIYRERRNQGYNWPMDPAIDVIEHLMSKIPVDIDLLIELAASGHYGIETSLARDPDLPLSVAMVLAGSREDGVKIALAENPHAPKPSIRKLVSGEEHVRWHALGNPNIEEEILVEAARHGTSGDKLKAVRNPALPAELLHAFARDQSNELRAAAASNPQLPNSILSELAEDSSPAVRRAVALNKNADSSALLKLVDDEDIEVRKALLLRDELPPSAIRSLAASTAEDSYMATKKYADNTEILEILARNGSRHALEKLAASESTSPKTLEWIYGLRNMQLVHILAHNPNMPNVTTVGFVGCGEEAQRSSSAKPLPTSRSNTTPQAPNYFDEDIPF